MPWRSSSSRRKSGLAADFMSDMLTDFWSNVTRCSPPTLRTVPGKTEIFEETGHVHHSLRRPRRRHLVRRHADTLARREDSRADPCTALCELRFRDRKSTRLNSSHLVISYA